MHFLYFYLWVSEKSLTFAAVNDFPMKRIFSFVTLSVLLVCPVERLLAWGQEGHRIIAQVAYDNMNCRARKQVDKILGKHGMIYVANWPDEIKSDTIYPTSFDWHFQDLNGGMSDSAVVAALTDYPKEGGNLFRAVDSLTNVLRQDKRNRDALAFIIHFMGDRFCPMHTGHIDDLGGNRIKVKWFGKNTNLHAIWDSQMIDARGYTYSEYAQYLQDKLGYQKKAIQQMTPAELLLHNYHLTEAIYAYHTEWDGNPYHYVYHFADDMEWQLYASGIRLAQLLNELYK